MNSARIALTGFPGWLTRALVDAMATGPDAGVRDLVLFAHPGSVGTATALAARTPWRASVQPLDLGDGPIPVAALESVDTVLHAAAIIHVRRTSDWYRINTEGTSQLALAAKNAGVRRFVFVSSIAAAGKSLAGRDLVEEDEARPLHHYGRSKLLAEQSLHSLHEAGRFEVVILRPAMFYGPPVPQRHIAIYRRILHGWMPLVGGGAYRRSLVHIENLVRLSLLAMTSPAAAGNVYFAVDRHAYSTRAVTDAMAEALGTRARYVAVPAALAEAAYQFDRLIGACGAYVAPIHLLGEAHWHQAASCAKAMRELGYDPKVDLREGMQAAIDWCKREGFL